MSDELENHVKDLADVLKEYKSFTSMALAGLVTAHMMAEKASDAEYRHLLGKALDIVLQKLMGEPNAGPTAGVKD